MVKKIFLAKIFFTDLSDYKIRPILVIKEFKDEDFLYLPLTTNLDLIGAMISNEDLETGSLNRPSVIIFPKIGILHKSFLVKEIATLKIEFFNNVMKLICDEFNCKGYINPKIN